MIPGSANPLLLASAAEAGPYQIERSLRFNSSDSAYLGATFGTPTDQDVFTLSMWVKRSALGSTQHLFGVSTNHSFGFTSGDALNLTFGGSSALTTTALFRDPSAWYHIVWTQNGTSHTIYVNNVSVGTATATSSVFNTAVAHQLGAGNTANFFNGYLAYIHFIDGQAKSPSSFGLTDENGIWQPKAYTGTYGTNGFHLPFSDNSTAAALGTDTSGNSNTWTVNNISVTAGAGNDSLVDTPTSYGVDAGNGGEVRGNYATLNPLSAGAGATLSNGNLDLSTDATNYGQARGTIGVSSGKWYFEIVKTGGSANPMIGIVDAATPTNIYPGNSSGSYSYYGFDGNKRNNSTSASYGAPYGTNDVIGVALDLDAGTLVFYKNGVSQGTAYSSLAGTFFPAVADDSGSISLTVTANFGQRPFAYPAPSGFKALCTQNLDTPLIAKPSTVMDVATDTGANILTATKALCGGNANFLWIKDRVNGSTNHHLIDIVRDPQLDGTPFLASNSTNDEATLGSYSAPSGNSVGWAWYAGSSTVSNTDGSITSQVRANPSAGFSIVSYTGDGAASATIGHGLNVAPQMIMVKNRDIADEGAVYHVGVDATAPEDYFLKLFSTSNGTAARDNTGAMWNDTAPTSSVFSVGTEDNVNASTEDYIAYCFTGVDGYSSFGSFVGGGTSPVFVYTGFRPRFILVKNTTSGGTYDYWLMKDTARDPYNASINTLVADKSYLENDSATIGTNQYYDFVSNGFVNRTVGAFNTVGNTFVYAAFAEQPFQFSRAR